MKTAKDILKTVIDRMGEQEVLDIIPQYKISKCFGKIYSIKDVCKLHKVNETTYARWVNLKFITPPDIKIKKRFYYSFDQLKKVNDQMVHFNGQELKEWLGPLPKENKAM